MKKAMRGALLSIAALSAFVIAAAPSQAATITPAGEAFTATSGNTQLTYSGVTLSCTESPVDGQVDSPGPTDTAEILDLAFEGTCTTSLGSAATVDDPIAVNGLPFQLIAQAATGGGDGTGVIRIPAGASVVVGTSGLFADCIFTVGPQDIDASFDATSSPQALSVNDTTVATTVTAKASGTGCLLAGSGNSTFVGDYQVSSANPLAIN